MNRIDDTLVKAALLYARLKTHGSHLESDNEEARELGWELWALYIFVRDQLCCASQLQSEERLQYAKRVPTIIFYIDAIKEFER